MLAAFFNCPAILKNSADDQVAGFAADRGGYFAVRSGGVQCTIEGGGQCQQRARCNELVSRTRHIP